MTDVHTKEQRSRNMAAIKSRGNESTEMTMARLLRQKNITGWRRHYKIDGRPDFIFKKNKIAVFIDGCFWHGCKRCYKQPKTNGKFWNSKIEENKHRDRKVNKLLKQKNWRAVRIWEHELKEKPDYAIKRVQVKL